MCRSQSTTKEIINVSYLSVLIVHCKADVSKALRLIKYCVNSILKQNSQTKYDLDYQLARDITESISPAF